MLQHSPLKMLLQVGPPLQFATQAGTFFVVVQAAPESQQPPPSWQDVWPLSQVSTICRMKSGAGVGKIG
jgi:hypothetical protein